MQEKLLFEYAVIRLVPRVEREEFINVGVVLFCSAKKYLKALYLLDREKLAAFSPALDISEMENYLGSFNKICEGARHSGPLGCLAPAERFRWLTATRSTVLQTSKVHPGFCKDVNEKVQELFEALVL
ncbi:MAG: DUF3037 domain-containing protein [Taibaiella sp.]|nr:DUF3037 domain-containing protein [Taibaiella sp.]